MRQFLRSGLTVLAVLFVGTVSLHAGDDGDPRDYRRDVERKLRDLERDEYERRRDFAEDLRDDDHVSPREYYRSLDRLERERREDLREYEEWRRERDEDFYRDQRRRHDRYYDDDVRLRYPDGYHYYGNDVPHGRRYHAGYRGQNDGFRVNVGRFSFYID